MRFRGTKPNLRRCLVPEGPFMMGTKGDSFDEAPAHRVLLSAFEMSQTPVLNRDYALFMKKSGADPPQWWDDPNFNNPDQPVVGVNWHEARAYCDWITERSGSSIRLPTEAEFEKASRGGLQGADYPWGNDPTGHHYKISKGPLTGPYKPSKNPPNAYGLHDVVSNIHQWCLDGYDPNYYEESPSRNPTGSRSADLRAARGATWNQENLACRCAARTALAAYFRVNDFGFRWVIGPRLE
jgi:sulfatase modifying factor 1